MTRDTACAIFRAIVLPMSACEIDSSSAAKVQSEATLTLPEPHQIEDTQPCHLLNLPPEIRLMAYEYVLIIQSDKYGAVRIVDRPNHFFRYCPRHLQPEPYTVLHLLRTCRTIHQEAKTIFYKVNPLMLQFDAPGQYNVRGLTLHTKWFLSSLGTDRLHAIREIAFGGKEWMGFATALI